MENLDNEMKVHCYVMIETLLGNIKGSGDLIRELEKLKEEYLKTIVN